MNVTNMALLVVRGVPRERALEQAQLRGAVSRGESDGLPVFGFTSPTDAVHTALELAQHQDVCCGVSAGEVWDRGDSYEGKAVQAAGELARGGPGGTVLLLEAVFFAMNRNEVSATLMDAAPETCLEQRVYCAAAVPKHSKETTIEQLVNSPVSEEPKTSYHFVPMIACGVLLAVFLGSGGWPRWGAEKTTAFRAQELADRGLHREASHAFFEAYLENPGKAEWEAYSREQLLKAASKFQKAGRPDAAFHLLREGLERDPFREDLESALLDTGMEYLETLLRNGSKDAFDLARVRLVELLPLKEKSIRDKIVGIHVKRMVQEWRQAKDHRLKQDIAQKTSPLWEESPGHPELLLAEAEFAAGYGRVGLVRENLKRLLDKHPKWARTRPEVAETLWNALKSLDEAYERKRYQGDLVGFAVQRLGDQLVPQAQEGLAQDDLGTRTSSFAYLDRLGKLTTEQKETFYRSVLQDRRSVGSKEGPLEDPVLLGIVVSGIQASQGSSRERLLEDLKKAEQTPGISGTTLEALRAAITSLTEASP